MVLDEVWDKGCLASRVPWAMDELVAPCSCSFGDASCVFPLSLMVALHFVSLPAVLIAVRCDTYVRFGM